MPDSQVQYAFSDFATYTAPSCILNLIEEGLNSGLLRLCSHCYTKEKQNSSIQPDQTVVNEIQNGWNP